MEGAGWRDLLDVDMDQDDKLFFIEAKYGLIGFAIVVVKAKHLIQQLLFMQP